MIVFVSRNARQPHTLYAYFWVIGDVGARYCGPGVDVSQANQCKPAISTTPNCECAAPSDDCEHDGGFGLVTT